MRTPTPSNGRARLLTLALVAATIGLVQAPANAAPTRTTFSQPSPIHLGEEEGLTSTTSGGIQIPASGMAGPYPSTVSFTRPGVITDVNVFITGLTHDSPDDLQLLLVGPGGEQALLMSHVSNGGAVSSVDIGLDDEWPLFEPNQALEDGATYRPTSIDPVDFPGADAPDLDGNNALDVFDGTDPTGEWQLFVHDSQAEGSGAIDDWSLSFELATTPYPSTLSVAGIGEVSDVDVTLRGIDSTYPSDLDLLLVGPQGQQAVLMSDAGGPDDVSDVDLTLDDGATEPLPDADMLTSGTFTPTNHQPFGAVDSFPDVLDPTEAADLSVFNGTDPHGVWALYAVDDAEGDLGAILGGWSLDIESESGTPADPPAGPTPPSGPVVLDTTAPTATVSVAAGSAYTTTSSVTVGVTATDTGPGASGPQQMRFSNDGTTWSAFQPYATTAPWTLAPGRDGSRSVFAQIRDGSGNLSPVVSDAITLDSRGPRVIKVKPRRDRDGVRPDARIKVITTEALAEATVTSTTVFLSRKGATTIAATLQVRGAKVILDPVKPLKPGTYRAKVTTGVTDLAGNAFDAKRKPGTQTLRWTFTV